MKGVRRNDQGELDIGDLYTYAFIMRVFHGQDTRKNTPRQIKKNSSRSWSLIESSFLQAVTELVLDPELVVASEAIRTMVGRNTTNPGGYITDMVTEDKEFPLNLAAELLVQNGATAQWFTHRWTTRYATSYLSEWGNRNYTKLSHSRIANTYRSVFTSVNQEQEDPFFVTSTTSFDQDEKVAHLPLTENLLDIVPHLPYSEAPSSCLKEIEGVKVNMDAEDIEERQIY